MKNLNKKDLNKEEKRLIKLYKKHNKNNQHKMNPIPVCQIPKNKIT